MAMDVAVVGSLASPMGIRGGWIGVLSVMEGAKEDCVDDGVEVLPLGLNL